MTSYALVVELKAKQGREDEVAALLASAAALARSEPGTLTWFVFRLDASTFGIFDTFADEAARDVHLNGPIARALMSRAEELLDQDPSIRKAQLLGQKVPRA